MRGDDGEKKVDRTDGLPLIIVYTVLNIWMFQPLRSGTEVKQGLKVTVSVSESSKTTKQQNKQKQDERSVTYSLRFGYASASIDRLGLA